MTPTREQLVRWLDEDGHGGCADELAAASDAEAPQAALRAATCVATEPYADTAAVFLPGQLRDWAWRRLVADPFLWQLGHLTGLDGWALAALATRPDDECRESGTVQNAYFGEVMWVLDNPLAPVPYGP